MTHKCAFYCHVWSDVGFSFSRYCHLVFIVLVLMYTPTSSISVVAFVPHSHSMLGLSCHLGSFSIFLMNNEYLFHTLISHLDILFYDGPAICTLKNGLLYWFVGLCIYFGFRSFAENMYWKYFLVLCHVPFSFLRFFVEEKFLILMRLNLASFIFNSLGGPFTKILLLPKLRK